MLAAQNNWFALCVIVLFSGALSVYFFFTWRRRKTVHDAALMDLDRGLVIHGFIIHLHTRTDRAPNVTRLLAESRAAGAELQVWRATDYRNCLPLPVRPFWDLTHPPGHWRDYLRSGEQGCLQSHLEAIQQLNGRAGIIIEDDANIGRDGFVALLRAGSLVQSQPCVLHALRAYPNGGLPPVQIAKLEASYPRPSFADDLDGWNVILYPNYSNALYFLTAKANTLLLEWVKALMSENLHRVPADDLLSLACDAHPGPKLDPHPDSWTRVAVPPLTGFAPGQPLASRLISESDTERTLGMTLAKDAGVIGKFCPGHQRHWPLIQ